MRSIRADCLHRFGLELVQSNGRPGSSGPGESGPELARSGNGSALTRTGEEGGVERPSLRVGQFERLTIVQFDPHHALGHVPAFLRASRARNDLEPMPRVKHLRQSDDKSSCGAVSLEGSEPLRLKRCETRALD